MSSVARMDLHARAGTPEWDCWETVEHLSDDLFCYAAQLGPRSPSLKTRSRSPAKLAAPEVRLAPSPETMTLGRFVSCRPPRWPGPCGHHGRGFRSLLAGQQPVRRHPSDWLCRRHGRRGNSRAHHVSPEGSALGGFRRAIWTAGSWPACSPPRPLDHRSVAHLALGHRPPPAGRRFRGSSRWHWHPGAASGRLNTTLVAVMSSAAMSGAVGRCSGRDGPFRPRIAGFR